MIAGSSIAQSEQQPQTPQIEAQKEAYSPLEGKKQTSQQKDKPDKSAAIIPEKIPGTSDRERDNNAKNSEEEGSEYWSPFLGLRLKITDSLLALFTFVLCIVGFYQNRQIKRSVNIAERALTDLERPAVFVEIISPGFSITVDGNFSIRLDAKFSYRFINYGRTPAQLVERIENWPTEGGGRTMPYPVDASKGGKPYPIGVIVGVDKPYDESIRLRDIYPIMVNPQEAGACIKNTICFNGFVRYEDIFSGKKYITGFCFIFDGIGQRFVISGDEKHNYNYEEK